MSTESIDPRYANYVRPSALQQRLDGMTTVDGNAAASELGGVKIAIIVGRWHSYIVDRLLQGALDTANNSGCLLYTSPSPRDRSLSRMPSSA